MRILSRKPLNTDSNILPTTMVDLPEVDANDGTAYFLTTAGRRVTVVGRNCRRSVGGDQRHRRREEQDGPEDQGREDEPSHVAAQHATLLIRLLSATDRRFQGRPIYRFWKLTTAVGDVVIVRHDADGVCFL